MEKTMVLSLSRGSTVCDLPFDAAVHETRWLTLHGEDDPSSAVARVDCDERGVILAGTRGTRLVLCGTDRELDGPALLEWGSSVMVGLSCSESDEPLTLYARPLTRGMRRFELRAFERETVCEIGRSPRCGIWYDTPFVSAHHARLTFGGGSFAIQDLRSGNGTFVNGRALSPLQPHALVVGDVIRILDLKVVVGRSFVLVNQPEDVAWRCHEAKVVSRRLLAHLPKLFEDVEGGSMPLFSPAPHLSQALRRLALEVEAPPTYERVDDEPAILRLGPSFLMAMGSLLLAAVTASRMASGSGVVAALPSLVMAIAMVCGSLVWPLFSRGYERRRAVAERERGVRAYVSYLDKVEGELRSVARNQARVLEENRPSVCVLMERARERSSLLMNNVARNEDFLELRVGLGDQPMMADITWPHEGFSLDPDVLWDKVGELERHPPRLCDVPLACNLIEKPLIGVVGSRARVWDFVRGMLVQICALHSYREVKVALVAEEAERGEWEFLTGLEHLHDGRHACWYLAVTLMGLSRLDGVLVSEADLRRRGAPDVRFRPHYVVVYASVRLARQSRLHETIAQHGVAEGMSVIYLADSLNDLPRDCSYLIDLDRVVVSSMDLPLFDMASGKEARPREACMFSRDDVLGTLVSFDPDIMVGRGEAASFAHDLARLRLGEADDVGGLPAGLGFLELFEVGSVEHLNIEGRWAASDASRTLSVPVGMDERGVVVSLDAHEKAHGPHGLVAGTTGSGKSELIVTYILSLCVCFSPDEVSFVLIDYKGGGLAGTFSNERYTLPHLAGTITNLDGGLVRRALVSLQSELRRRQRLLNLAREAAGETSVDIYRYLQLYRQGVLSEPLPHLFVVADEFAELKQQEPDFMEELMSAARIGRSLGVHLVLATQKPAGVVSDQIWANARFKVCLKVSDVADSRELLRRDDAAHIARPGEFRFLVGYDEAFVAGQAAYAGTSYVARERFEPQHDTSVLLLDGEGEVVARRHMPMPQSGLEATELEVTLAQIEHIARRQGMRARPLWLEPLPNRVVLGELMGRYDALALGGLTCVLGEADDPEQQRRHYVTTDLTQVGNLLLYGPKGSDVEGLLRCGIASLVATATDGHLWLYGLDLGAGTLGMLDTLPQVGGVVRLGDDEGMRRLVRMLAQEVASRREGVGANAESRPRVVLAVANLPALAELDGTLSELLDAIVRDGHYVGVYVMATAEGPSSVRVRLQACFGEVVACGLGDSSEYTAAFGEMVSLLPVRMPRRGLARIHGRLLEFQGASLCKEGESEEARLEQMGKGAQVSQSWAPPSVPRLPAVVTPQIMGEVSGDLLPLGLAKQDVTPLFANIRTSPCVLVAGNDIDAIGSYLGGVHQVLSASLGKRYCLLDRGGVAKGAEGSCVACDLGAIGEAVGRMTRDATAYEVVVVANVTRVLEELPEAEADLLRACLLQGEGCPAFVLAVEAWRMSSVYDQWWHKVTAQDVGLWVGQGFADQTVLRYPRMQPEYRAPLEHGDGFWVARGEVEPVRLLQAGEIA